MNELKEKQKKEGQGPKFFIDIEGTKYPWEDYTITTEEIIATGEWDSKDGAIIIDMNTQEQRTLEPGEIIEIKPGMGFAKKVRFKRG